MTPNAIKSVGMVDKTRTSFSQREEKDGRTKEITVKEVENGYIVEVYTSWTDKEDGYQSTSKTYISKTNPIKKKKEEIADEDLSGYVTDFLQGLNF